MSHCCNGYCASCRTHHFLPSENALKMGRRLFDRLEEKKHIDIFRRMPRAVPSLDTSSLFGEARGKMFGVLECLQPGKTPIWLFAFSGQFNGRWLVPGWSPPLFDVASFRQLHDPIERQITQLGEHIERLPTADTRRVRLQRQRKSLSRTLMRDIHSLYRLTNFRALSAGLDTAFLKQGDKPTGTGDCCAPKLLNHAALLRLQPLSLAEFYFGRDNRSGTKTHGRFYPPCSTKCAPLIGFMLCGTKREGGEGGD